MKSLNAHSLHGLRVIEAVARNGTLSRAAAELGSSIGAVSQQVARAEKALGLQLFDRSREGMLVRPEAAEFLSRLGEGFARVGQAVEALEHRRDKVVTISVAPIFATRWLIWRLKDFYAQHPDIKVRIDINTGLIDPARADMDFGIRIGPGDWPGVKAEPLFDQLIVPVCSPEVACQLRVPSDLSRVPIIRDPAAMFGWDAWLGPEGVSDGILGEGPEFPDSAMCLDAAISGLGVFLAFEVLVHDALRMGSLVMPFPRYRRTGFRYALVSAPDRVPGPDQQLFRRWLKKALREEGLGEAGMGEG